MSKNKTITILCVSSYEKGHDFMRECKEQGCKVLLLTSKSLESATWPKEVIDEIFFMPDKNKEWNMRDVIYGVSFLARKEKIDRIVALDDLDIEKAAALREHLRVPGMGDTTARYFRDKLAMRIRAKEMGIPVPEFIHVLNHDEINNFAERVSFPFMIKARMLAGAHGLKKVHNKQEMWKKINQLGDEQSFYLMERFVPGNIYHVDSIIYEHDIRFAIASQYGKPPFEVAHEGRVFTSRTIEKGSTKEQELLELNEKLLKALGLLRGVSHTEFIESEEDGKLYFLETSARVGGANLSELVLAASGINLWREWAKIEILKGESEYQYPEVQDYYAGIITSLAKQEWPDLSAYEDPEIFWQLNKSYHAGFVLRSKYYNVVGELLEKYTERFYRDFFTSAPMKDRPSD